MDPRSLTKNLAANLAAGITHSRSQHAPAWPRAIINSLTCREVEVKLSFGPPDRKNAPPRLTPGLRTGDAHPQPTPRDEEPPNRKRGAPDATTQIRVLYHLRRSSFRGNAFTVRRRFQDPDHGNIRHCGEVRLKRGRRTG